MTLQRLASALAGRYRIERELGQGGMSETTARLTRRMLSRLGAGAFAALLPLATACGTASLDRASIARLIQEGLAGPGLLPAEHATGAFPCTLLSDADLKAVLGSELDKRLGYSRATGSDGQPSLIATCDAAAAATDRQLRLSVSVPEAADSDHCPSFAGLQSFGERAAWASAPDSGSGSLHACERGVHLQADLILPGKDNRALYVAARRAVSPALRRLGFRNNAGLPDSFRLVSTCCSPPINAARNTYMDFARQYDVPRDELIAKLGVPASEKHDTRPSTTNPGAVDTVTILTYPDLEFELVRPAGSGRDRLTLVSTVGTHLPLPFGLGIGSKRADFERRFGPPETQGGRSGTVFLVFLLNTGGPGKFFGLRIVSDTVERITWRLDLRP